METTEQVLARLGTPPEFLNLVNGRRARLDQIAGERYAVDRRAEEESKTNADYKAGADKWQAAVNDAADKEADKEIKAIESAFRREHDIPAKNSTEFGTDYAERLARTTIRDIRTATLAHRCDTDVRLILELEQPAAITDIVQCSFLTDDVEVIRRVGLAAELRLARLARTEVRRGQVDKPATTALFKLQDELRVWRAKTAAASPAVKREQIIKRREIRKAEAQRIRAQAEEALGLNRVMDGLKRKEKVEALLAQQAQWGSSGLVVGPAFQR